MPLPDVLIGHLVELELLGGDAPPADLVELTRRLARDADAVDTVPASTARTFAPTVSGLFDRLLSTPEAAEELFEDGTLEVIDTLAKRLGAAAGPGTAPPGTPVSARYRAGAAPIVLTLATEPATGNLSRTQRLVQLAMREFGGHATTRVPDLALDRPPWVTDGCADLAECVSLIAATTGLPLPDGGVVAVGAAKDIAFTPLSADEIDTHRRAWQADGRFGAFLAPTVAGWLLCTGGEERTVKDPKHNLSTAAAMLFGETWDSWRRARFEQVLAASKWSMADLTPRNDPFEEIDTPKIDTVVRKFDRDKLKVVILGGGASSGKRVAATRVVDRLRGLHWQCVALSVKAEQELPTRDEIIVAANAAFALSPHTSRRDRLLVLLGIRPIGAGNIGEVLAEIGKELGVHVFCLPRYEMGANTEWETEGLTLIHATSGPGESADFAKQLVRKLPKQLGELSDEDLETAARRYPSNLRSLCKELRRLARGTVEPKRDLRATLAEMEGGERDAVALTAARSLLGRQSPRAELGFLSADELGALEFVHTVRPGYVTLADTDVAEALLVAHDQLDDVADPDHTRAEAVNAALVRQVCRELGVAARSDDAGDRRTIAIVVSSARAFSFRVAQQAVEAFVDGPDFTRWQGRVEADEVAAVLKAAGSLLGSATKDLCTLLVDRIGRLPADVPPSTLRVLAEVLRRYRTLIDEAAFKSCLEWLWGAAPHALRIAFTSRMDAYALLTLLVRLHDPKLNDMVVSGAQDLLAGLDATSLMDCLLVYRVDQLVERAARLPEVKAHTRLAEHPEVLRLIAVPPSRDSFALTLIRFALRVHFVEPENWENLVRAAEPVLIAGIANDSAYDLHVALSQAGDIRVAFTNRVLQSLSGFSEAVADLIRSPRTSPAEAANLLNTIRRLHLHRAYQVLYLPNGSPDAKLAEDLVKIASDLNDGKGAGLLLAALNAIDENFRTGETSFGTLVAEMLGLDWVSERLRLDSRASTRYHLLREIWTSEAAYRGELVETALAIITKTINSGVDPWGPQLALQLGQHPEFGWDLLVNLRDRLHDRFILNGMVGLQNAQAQVHYHRLGRALFPHLTGEFSREFDHIPLATNVISSSMSDMAQGAAAAAETLLISGVPDAGRRMAAAVFGSAEKIEERVRRMFGPAELATVLRSLARLDPDVVRTVVSDMLTPEPAESGDGHEMTTLERKARQAMYDSPSSGVELLTAVEHALAGGGKQIVANTQGQAVWRIFFGELRHLQDPLELYTALRGLARVGVLPSTSGAGRLDTIYNRWSYRIGEMTSPVRLAQLLRLFLIWGNSVWLRTIANNVNYDNLRGRISRARPNDLAAVPGLAEALVLAGQTSEARKLAELAIDLGEDTVSSRTDLWQLLRLHECAKRLRADTDSWLTATLSGKLAATVRQLVIYDERRHWLAIGWAADRLGANAPAVIDPDVRPNMARPYLMGWALSAFPESAWRERELDRVRSLVHGAKPASPAEFFSALVMQDRLGEEFVDVDDPGMAAALKAMSFRQLAALQGIAMGSPAVAGLLRSWEPELKVRTGKPLSRCEILATDVRNGFSRIPDGEA